MLCSVTLLYNMEAKVENILNYSLYIRCCFVV